MAGYIGGKVSVVTSGTERKQHYNITTTTTSLTGLQYTPTKVHVFHNGVRLVDGTDYTATTGTSITLTNAAQNGDDVVVISYASFQTSDTVSAANGGTFAGAVDVNADGATVLTVDRATSDGTVIDVQKNGSTVGSIGTTSSRVILESGGSFDNHAGFRLYASNGAISRAVEPYYNSSNSDGEIDLGRSTARFKNLYLSGGVSFDDNPTAVGGSVSAKTLDDYEEGTWTPTYISAAGLSNVTGFDSITANYVKVGSLVTLRAKFELTNTGSESLAVGDYLYMGGLPFAPVATDTGGVQAFLGNIYGYESLGGNKNATGIAVKAVASTDFYYFFQTVVGAVVSDNVRCHLNLTYNTTA